MSEKRNFKKGDIITFCGEEFEVLENNGHSGKVREVHGGTIINTFYWDFAEEKCELKISKRICRKCGHEVTKSEIEGYPYQCKECDEDLYTFETEQKGEEYLNENTKDLKEQIEKQIRYCTRNNYKKTKTKEHIINFLNMNNIEFSYSKYLFTIDNLGIELIFNTQGICRGYNRYDYSL